MACGWGFMACVSDLDRLSSAFTVSVHLTISELVNRAIA